VRHILHCGPLDESCPRRNRQLDIQRDPANIVFPSYACVDYAVEVSTSKTAILSDDKLPVPIGNPKRVAHKSESDDARVR
jgi:hypothetical protein